MAIWLTHRSKVLVQGMTGSEGRKHTQRMLNAGTAIVGGVTPGKGGQTVEFNDHVNQPVFDSVADAVAKTGADVSVVFVPARGTKAAVIEAVDAGVPLVVVHGGRGSLTTISSRWRRWLDSLSYPQVHLLGRS